MDADGLVSWVPRQIRTAKDAPVLMPGRQPSIFVEWISLPLSKRRLCEWRGLEGWALVDTVAMAVDGFGWDADGREVAP